MDTRSRRPRALPLVRSLLVCLVLVCLFNIGRILWGYHTGAREYEALRNSLAVPAASPSGQGGAARPAVDMERLIQRYPDAVGWLYCEGTALDYPVMQAQDNDYYLRRLPGGEWNMSGSLFLDWRCAADFSDGLSIVYGHNMKDGSMFACLANYADPAWSGAHPALSLQTAEAVHALNVLYAFSIPAQEWADRGFDQAENRTALLEYAAAHAVFESGRTPAADARLVALLTCTNGSREERFAVLCEMS